MKYNLTIKFVKYFSTHKLVLKSMNRYSRIITESKSQGASQAMLLATGINADDINMPQVGVCSVWYEGNPCNMHLLELGKRVKKSIVATKKLSAFQFNTIGISDGISMGTKGMSYSLPSRELIADSIESVMTALHYDGIIAIPGCDKNMPGCLMGMLRINRPGLIVYGGSIRPGKTKMNNKAVDIVSAFQSYGEFIAGRITEEERMDIICNACPGPGSCGGMYTANTMGTAFEVMGISLPHSSSSMADSAEKQEECGRVGTVMEKLLKIDLKPRDIITLKAVENAIRFVMIMGGSTNAVLHLIAIARTAGIPLSLDDFKRLAETTPVLANLKPSGEYVMEDISKLGGIPRIMKYLMIKGILDGTCMTVTGHTIEDNLKNVKPIDASSNHIVRPLEKPLQATGHIKILHGNLAPRGSVAKLTDKIIQTFQGPAKIYDSEEAMLQGLIKNEISKGDVVVIRYEGPKGGPGMREMLTPTSAIAGAGLSKEVALITDGRFSGGSHGFIVGHICPEAAEGGPIGLIKDGDIIIINAKEHSLTVELSSEELLRREKEWVYKGNAIQYGYLKRYMNYVQDASYGCICDPV